MINSSKILIFDIKYLCMNKDLETISIESLQKEFPALRGLSNQFLISEAHNHEEFLFGTPVRLDGIIIYILKRGHCEISVNFNTYEVNPGDSLICVPNDIIEIKGTFGDVVSQLVVITSDYLRTRYATLNSFVNFYMPFKENPFISLTKEDAMELDKSFHETLDATRGDEYFYDDILNSYLAVFLYRMASRLYLRRPDLKDGEGEMNKRDDAIFNQFIRLLKEYHKTERRVDFYARELFLTPKHFSSAVKSVSGKTASVWIDEYVVLSAKALLKYSNKTIQEIAEELNFANSSFFGKYFKNNTGMTPSAYRKKGR